MSKSNDNSLFNGIKNIWIVIAITSIILTSLAFLSIRPSYSIDSLTTSNKNSSNINSNSSNNKISSISVQSYDKLKNCAADQHTPTNPTTYLTHFNLWACYHFKKWYNITSIYNHSLRKCNRSNFQYWINF